MLLSIPLFDGAGEACPALFAVPEQTFEIGQCLVTQEEINKLKILLSDLH